MDRSKKEGGASNPIGPRRTVEVDALPGEDLRLPAERQRVGVLSSEPDEKADAERAAFHAAIDKSIRIFEEAYAAREEDRASGLYDKWPGPEITSQMNGRERRFLKEWDAYVEITHTTFPRLMDRRWNQGYRSFDPTAVDDFVSENDSGGVGWDMCHVEDRLCLGFRRSLNAMMFKFKWSGPGGEQG